MGLTSTEKGIKMFKFTAAAADINNALATLTFTHDKIRPLLGCVKVTVENGIARFIGTNVENYMTICVNATTFDSGMFAVNTKQFRKIVGKTGSVTVEVNDDGAIKVTTGSGTFSLEPFCVGDFPMTPDYNTVKVFEIDADALKTACDTVAYATARNESCYSLTGMYVEAEDDGVSFVGTDTHRLATVKVKLPVAEKVNINFLPETLRLINKVAKGIVEVRASYDADDEKKLAKTLVICGENFIIRAATVEGQFPRWREVIPGSLDFSFVLNAPEVAKKVKALMPVVNEITRSIRTFQRGSQIVFRSTQDGSEIAVDANTEGFWGFNVNLEYLLEVLAVFKGNVLVSLNENSTLKFTDGNSVHLLSPVYMKNGFDTCPCCGGTNSNAVHNMYTKAACSEVCAERALTARSANVKLPAEPAKGSEVEKEFKVTAKMIKELMTRVKDLNGITDDQKAWAKIAAIVG
jgi:DNA polymerase-3 subunit beta